MSKRRILLGLAAMVAIETGGYFLPVLGAGRIGPEMAQSLFVVFVGAFAGGWVARRRFLLLALTFWLAIWAAIVYLYYSIAAPTGQAPLLSIPQFFWVSVALSGAATAVGAISGQTLATSRSRGAAAAT